MILNVEKTQLVMAKKKMSQNDIANLLDVSAAAVCGYFKNANKLRSKTIGRLANALQVDIEEIID